MILPQRCNYYGLFTFFALMYMQIITWAFVPLDLNLPNQPNRAVRARMLRGVGGGSCEASSYPDSDILSF